MQVFKTVNKFLFLNSTGFQSREYNPQPIKGKDFKFEKTAGYENDYMIHNSWIMRGKNDRRAAIIFTTYNTNGVFFNINYCPIC